MNIVSIGSRAAVALVVLLCISALYLLIVYFFSCRQGVFFIARTGHDAIGSLREMQLYVYENRRREFNGFDEFFYYAFVLKSRPSEKIDVSQSAQSIGFTDKLKREIQRVWTSIESSNSNLTVNHMTAYICFSESQWKLVKDSVNDFVLLALSECDKREYEQSSELFHINGVKGGVKFNVRENAPVGNVISFDQYYLYSGSHGHGSHGQAQTDP